MENHDYAGMADFPDFGDYDYGNLMSEGKIYYAMYNYTAQTEHNISFKRGDRLLVIDQANDDWWIAYLGPAKGYIPANHVCQNTISLGPWYFKNCTRREAERILENAKPGHFLIRDRDITGAGSVSAQDTANTEQTNQSLTTAYSLSLKVDDEKIEHYKITVAHVGKPTGEAFESRYYINKKKFKTLQALVHHYKKNLGLGVALTEPCPVELPSNAGCMPQLQDRWELKLSELHFIEVLGAGQFGEVWRGEWNNILKVAIKKIIIENTNPEVLANEVQILKKLHHKHLVQLFGLSKDKKYVYIVTELAEKGSLQSILKKAGKRIDFTSLNGHAADVASGMAYLEGKNFIHRDLATRNVVMMQNGTCKICDFGLARCIEENDYKAKKGSKFPVRWTAPEAISYGKFTTKSDVWSYGIMCFELMTQGKTPYSDMSNQEVIDNVNNRNYRLSKPSKCPDWFYQVMLKCWEAKPENRPSFRSINRTVSKKLHDDTIDKSTSASPRIADTTMGEK